MPAPTTPTFSAAAKVAAHTAFRDLLDAATAAGKVRIRSNADVLLAEIPLTDPSGSINGTTGVLTITTNGRDESADATGVAAYAELCDGDNLVHLALPAVAGGTPVAGFVVLNTLSIDAGGPVELLLVQIG